MSQIGCVSNSGRIYSFCPQNETHPLLWSMAIGRHVDKAILLSQLREDPVAGMPSPVADQKFHFMQRHPHGSRFTHHAAFFPSK